MESISTIVPSVVEAIKQTTSPREEALKRLEDGVSAIQNGDDFKALLSLASKFWDYSWRNWMLIGQQCPDATRVAGYKAWQKLGRQVRKGEKAIKIFAPLVRKVDDGNESGDDGRKVFGFRVASVFDVRQTDGEPLPSLSVPVLDGEDGKELYARLADFARTRFTLVDDKSIEASAAGYWQPLTNEIHIDCTLSQLQRTKTLAHELAHAVAGHGQPGDTTSTREAETVAESVAFLVCDRFGLDTSERSFPYVAAFARDMETFARVLGEVQAIAKAVIDRGSAVFV